MPYEQNLLTLTGIANSSLAAKQFYAVTTDPSNAGQIVLATAAKSMSGVLQDKPVAGEAGEYAYSGVTKVAITASTAISANALLEVDTGGTFKTLAGGTAVAQALEGCSSLSSVQLISARLLPSNAAFA